MTPKDKAEELYLKYKDALNIRHDMRPGANPFAKQCALIAVDEILNTEVSNSVKGNDYWQEVKQQISNL